VEVLLKLPIVTWPFALALLLVHSALMEPPSGPEG
jgi:hypothetical protein